MFSHSSFEPVIPKTKPLSPIVPRQRPGLACEECRRRKIRCGRERPACGSCVDSATICFIKTDRLPRGPKKGHLRALKVQISSRERHLSLTQPTRHRPAPSTQESHNLSDNLGIDPLNEYTVLDIFDDNTLWNQNFTSPSYATECSMSPAITNIIPEFSPRVAGPDVSKLLHADLDQLYFDRVQTSIPIINRRRYFSWTHLDTKNEFCDGLQYAMWTLASTYSAHLEFPRDAWYADTKNKLETLILSSKQVDIFPIELAQAWILLTIYEFIRAPYRQALMTARRTFRLVQQMRLYEVDGPSVIPRPASDVVLQEEWIETEERRRTFWMVYCLIGFINIREGSLLALNEQAILTRLPAPEMDFQNGRPIVMDYLSELITTKINLPLNTFTECIILATICGRSLSNSQVDQLTGNAEGSWDRHIWLDTILTQCIQGTAAAVTPVLDPVEQMVLFSKIMGQATVLLLYKSMKSVAAEIDDHRVMYYYQERSVIAAQEIVSLVRTLPQFCYFKIHPFTPICLVLCAEFIAEHKFLHESFGDQLHEILEVLRKLEAVNNLARSSLCFVGFEDLALVLRDSSEEFSKWGTLLNYDCG